MADLLGVVSKPQFDTDILQLGKAVHINKITSSNGYELINSDAIILHSMPLQLVVVYVNVDKYNSDNTCEKTLPIDIKEVVDGTVKITNLKEEK